MRRSRNPFPGVAVVRDRHGKRRYRLRRQINGRSVDTYLAGEYGGAEFRMAYEAAISAARESTARRSAPGTLAYLITAYLDSTAFRNLAADTRRSKRYRLDWLREAVGPGKYATMEPHHAEALMQKKGGPNAANRLKADLAQLYRYAAKRFRLHRPEPGGVGGQLQSQTRRLPYVDGNRDPDLPGCTPYWNQSALGV